MRPVSASICWGRAVGVGALELGELAPFEQLRRQQPLIGRQLFARNQLFQHFRAGAPFARRSLLPARQAELAEQQIRDLHRRADVEALTGVGVNLVLEAREALRELARKPREHAAVHA